jgi:hypothetical protein
MGINFPNAPTTGQLYPQPAVAGLPVYRWDGQKWTTQGASPMSVYVADTPPAASDNSLWWESDSGILYVRYNDGDSTQWVAVTPSGSNASNDVGRNLLHNPLFNIAQRGAGPFTSTQYTLDRWVQTQGGSTASTSQVALADSDRSQIGDEAATYAFNTVVGGTSGAGDVIVAVQKIENVRRLAGKTVTVSFWAHATAALKIGVSLDQNFGTGGSPSAQVPGNGIAVTAGTTWARYSVTFTLPSVAGQVWGTNGNDCTILNLWFTSGTNYTARSGGVGMQSGTFALWGVQLEVGTVATPLEKPDPQQDLAKCQRFFQDIWASLFAPVANLGSYGGALTTVSFPVTMRTTPAVVFDSISAVAWTGSTTPAFAAAPEHAYFNPASTQTTAGAALYFRARLSADL